MSRGSKSAFAWVLAIALGIGALARLASAEEPAPRDSTTSLGSAYGDSLAPFDSTAGQVLVTEHPYRPVDYLWVVRTSLVSPEEIDRALAHAREVGVRGVIVQVIGRGDAYYRSNRLPRAEALPQSGPGLDFDPLGYLIPRARAAGLEVHAWINCCLVWSAPQPPRDRNHVVLAHPEWIARLRDGRRTDRLRERDYHRLGIEGAFLSPAHPAVRTWVARNAQEIASRYPVDGIHLDYIRQPGPNVGLDNATRSAFALRSGVDLARPGKLDRHERAQLDSAFAAFQGEQVTAMVREVRDSLAGFHPMVLSAAVKPNLRDAERYWAQPWPTWILSGLLDLAFPMCYSPITQTVLDQLVATSHRLGTAHVVPGIAVYNAGPSTVAASLKGARALGYRDVALYSLDALFARPGYWPALKDRLSATDGEVH